MYNMQIHIVYWGFIKSADIVSGTATKSCTPDPEEQMVQP